MNTNTKSKVKAQKPMVKVNDLKPVKNPKAGIKSSVDGWGSNHNETCLRG